MFRYLAVWRMALERLALLDPALVARIAAKIGSDEDLMKVSETAARIAATLNAQHPQREAIRN